MTGPTQDTYQITQTNSAPLERNPQSVSLYETEFRGIIASLRSQYSQQMTVSVQEYPLDSNREARKMRGSPPEQLVIL